METTNLTATTLAYYWDHKDELDADIERRLESAVQLQQAAGDSPVVVKLLSQGFL